ncbi:MAG TPA: hypothetical protein PKZ99_03190 [Azospirillaceae bacterium]|nr:hypothetical protein [Azospirillaceae bacterium]
MQLTTANVALWGAGMRERMRQRHINTAVAAKAKVEARQGKLPLVTVVDGRRDRREDEVKSRGNITYLFDPTPHAAKWLLAYLTAIAPVDKSKHADHRVFKSSFTFLVNGEEKWLFELDDMPFGSRVTIINLRFGYSRLLEHGWSLQAPSGVMAVAAAAAKTTFRRSVQVEYAWMAVEADITDDPDRDPIKGDYRYPVIHLQALQS